MTNTAWKPLLAAVVVALLATVLRAQFVYFPTDAHVDERIVGKLAERASRTGSITADWAVLDDPIHSHPTLQFSPHSLAVESAAIVARRISGREATVDEAIRKARWFSVVCGGAAVFATYLAGLAWSQSATAALIAEVFHAAAFLHVQDCCYARVEAMLSLLVGMSVWLAGRLLRSPRAFVDYAVLGFAIGLAVAAKYNAAPLMFFAAIPLATDRRLRSAAVVVVGAAAGFLAGTPEILVSPGSFWAGVSYEAAHYRSGHIPHQAFDGWDFNVGFWIEYLAKLGVGWIPLVLSVAFALFAVVGRRREWSEFAAFLVVAAFATAAPTVRFERNAEVVLAALCIAAGWMLAELGEGWKRRWSSRTNACILAVFVAAACLQSGLAMVRFRKVERRGASPLHRIPSELNVASAVWHGNIWQQPPADWRNLDAVVLYGRSDRFSVDAFPKWIQQLKGWEVRVYDSHWRRWGYPFSTVEVYHGPLYVLTAVRR